MDRIFCYDPRLLSEFPNLHSGLVLADGVHNTPSPAGLLGAYHLEQKVVLEQIGRTPLSEITSLAAWRAAFRKFGVDPTQYRSAAEALLRRLIKKGDIPSINALADIANMVSIHYALPVAAFDLDRLKLPITVRFADGNERYTPLDEDMVENPVPGEVIFADETGLVVARRWCYRQSNESAVREGTRQVLFTIEAQHTGSEAEVHQATTELVTLINQYVGGYCQTAWLP